MKYEYRVSRVLNLCSIVLLIAVFVAGCQTTDDAAQYHGLTGEPYKIGGVLAVTGDASPLGTPQEETARLLEEQINRAGGINGRPLKIIVMDSKSKEIDTLMAIRRLIDEGVVAIVGPSQTGTTMAIADAIERAEIPLISCAAGVVIVDPVMPWVFKTAQSDVHAVAKLIDYLKEEGINSIAMLSVSNAFGESGKVQLQKQAREANIRIVAEEAFRSEDKDMTAQLTRINRQNPGAVICWGTNPGPAIVARNMRQLGMEMPLLMSHGIANKRFIELAGNAADGIIFPAGRLIVADEIPDTDPQKLTLMDYRDAFQAKFNKEPDTFGGHAWDAIQLVVDALREVGDDRAKLREAIENTEGFVGIGGVFSFDSEEHNGLTKDSFVLVTIENGDWRMVH